MTGYSSSAINVTNTNVLALFTITKIGGGDNITKINITAVSNVSFVSPNNATANGWVCNTTASYLNCTCLSPTGAPGAAISVYMWSNYTGRYTFNMNFTDNSSAVNSSTTTLYVDTTPPTFTLTTNGTNLYNITAGATVNISAVFTSDVAPISYASLNASLGDTFFRCFINASVSTANPTYSLTANCTFSNTSCGGVYNIVAVVADTASFTNRTEQSSGPASSNYFTAWNGRPMAGYNPSQMRIQNESFAQKRQRYDIMVPIYQGGDNISVKDDALVNPMAYDNSTVLTSNTMEDLAYNYSFNLNFSSSGIANGSLVDFNFSLMMAALANQSTMSVYSPDGNIKSITMMMPDWVNNEFSIYLNGTRYQSVGAISSTHPINGTYAMNTGKILLTANVTDNGSLIPMSLVISAMPPVNLTEQTITGFTPNNPPALGSSISTSFYVYLNATNEYFSTENMTATFIFPHNVTFSTFAGSDNETQPISTEILLRAYNETNSLWVLIANSSNTSFHNASIVRLISESINMSNMPGSPMAGKNVSIQLWGFRYMLDQNVSLGWKKGSSVRLNATALLNFSHKNTTIGSGAAGTSVVYNATVNMGVSGGLNISSDNLPGFSTSATVSSLTLNGRTLTENVNFVKGSIVINGAALQQGSNTISLTYSVPAAAAATSSGGGGGGASSATPSIGEQTTTIATIRAQESVQVRFSDTLLDVRAINLTVNRYMQNVKMTVKTLAEKPVEVTEPSDELYKYFQVTTQNIGDADVVRARMQFRVNRTWYSENGFDPETTAMYRYTDGAWQKLALAQLESDSNYYNFEADTPGFSTFAVTALLASEPVETCTNVCPSGQSQNAYPDCSCYTPEQPAKPPEEQPPAIAPPQQNNDWIIYGIVIAVITAILILYIFKRAELKDYFRPKKPHK